MSEKKLTFVTKKHNIRMKKSRFPAVLLLSVTLYAMIFSACGGANNRDKEDSTSISLEIVTDSIAEEKRVAMLCADSIYVPGGPSVRVGMKIADVAPSSPGLYDSVLCDRGPEADELRFMRDGQYLFTAMDFGEERVDLIMANSTDVIVEVPDEDPITLATGFKRVLDLHGVRSEWCGLDDSGIWYWTWHGLWFAPSQEHLSESLSERLYNPSTPPRMMDFTDDTGMGYIGTGVPF